ncbi:hypothetical protein D3C74_323060 [compost metagenome]
MPKRNEMGTAELVLVQHLADRLRVAREDADLSREEVAALAAKNGWPRLGYSGAIRRVELARREPTVPEAAFLATTYGTSLEALLSP